jgi:hypothetical protein
MRVSFCHSSTDTPKAITATPATKASASHEREAGN